MNIHRQSLEKQTTLQERANNIYGLIVSKKGNNPIICGHGGSMWLCKSCGEKCIKEKWAKFNY